MRTMRKLIAASAALAMLASSTAAGAAQAPQRTDPWAILAVTSGAAPAAVMCGSAAATAQGPTGCVLPALDAAAPPPPPLGVAPATPPPAYAGVGLSGELLPFLLWFGLIAVALATSGSGRPNSPG